MLRSFPLNSPLQKSVLSLSPVLRLQSTSTVRIPDEKNFNKALPYSRIPGPKPLPLISIAYKFLPGGKYHNQGVNEMHTLMKEEFGDVVRFPKMFGKPEFVFIYNPKDVELLFRTEGQWPFRRGLEILDYFRQKERPDLFQGIGGVLQDQGAVWQDTRTKVNPVMMQPKIVKSYIPVVQLIADEFVDRIKLLRDEKLEAPENFSNELNKWALESISYIALDQRLNLMKDDDPSSDGQKLIETVHDFFMLSYELEFLPSIWKYYKTKKFKKLISRLHEMADLITKFIDKSIEEVKEKPVVQNRELSVLEKLLKIDKRVAIIMALDMLMAGVDTTSTATAGILYQLAKNPEKQEILRKEILEKLPNKDSQLTPESMANMPYLRAVIKETMRITPVALGTARRCQKDLVFGGYKIPKGIDVVFSQFNMSMNENLFKRPQEFIPERHLKAGELSELKGTSPFAFLPFGFGSRMCVGRRMAEMEMEILVAKIIRNFRIEWPHPDMKYASKLLFMPSDPLKYRFVDL